MTDSARVRFRLNWRKTIETLVWLSSEKPGLSFYYIAKICFYADKMHLQRYGRPIFGDRYIAMEHGPVPSVVYDILRANSFLDPDILSTSAESFQVRTVGNQKTVSAIRDPDLGMFSEADLECLNESLDTYGNMPVSQLRRLTHQEPAYIEATLNGEMDYTLMIDEDIPDRESIIEELRETAAYVVI